jgi:hypothetical protein
VNSPLATLAENIEPAIHVYKTTASVDAILLKRAEHYDNYGDSDDVLYRTKNRLDSFDFYVKACLILPCTQVTWYGAIYLAEPSNPDNSVFALYYCGKANGKRSAFNPCSAFKPSGDEALMEARVAAIGRELVEHVSFRFYWNRP